VVGQQNADIADTLHARTFPWQPFLAFYIWGVHWRHLAHMTELSMCSGDAALCQITLTTCLTGIPLHCHYMLGTLPKEIMYG